MIRAAVTALALLAAPATAQEASSAGGGKLRVLDKISGAVNDLDLPAGETAMAGRLEIFLGECRFPSGNPAGDAYALLTIIEQGEAEAAFRGWMIASAPALNPMDHPRYDVWVLGCITS